MRKLCTLLCMLLLLSAIAFSQVKTITGTIRDAKGEPVPFATVKIKGGKSGVSADANGKFSISAKQGDVLVVSATDITQREIAVGGSNAMDIAVVRSQASLSEVVITASGIRRTDKALGYAISKVDPEALLQKSEPDMLKSLQGKVAGVDIRSSQGTPGAATRIQIRGNASFQSTQPLIIVDGVPYSNSQLTTSSQTSGGTAYGSGIANLDPNDIATMNVLKGVAASSLYGSRAAAGVVVITTKSGSATRNKKGIGVNVRSSVSWENVANLPKYQNLYGTGSQGGYSNSNGSWGPAFTALDSIPAWPDYKAAYPDLFPSANIKYRAYPNNVKDLFKTGMLYENSVGLSGGDEKTSVALTLSNLTQSGYIENSDYGRNNVGIGAQTKLKDWLTVGGNFSYVRSKQKGGYFGENQVDGASSVFARTLFLGRNWDLNLPYQDKNGVPLTPNGGGQFDNPRWAALNNVATTFEERTVAGARAEVRVNNWIRINYNFGANTSNTNRREITELNSRAASGLGRLVVDNFRQQELESVLLLTLNPKLNDDFDLRVIFGNEINQRTTTRQYATGSQFIVPGLYTLDNTKTQVFNPGGDTYSRRRLLGVYTDITLGYKNYAFLNVSGRMDKSSTLPVKNNTYFYPQASFSFVFTDAFGLKSNWLDYGKVRASWARVGNDANPNSIQDVFNVGVNFLGQPTAARSGTTYDPNLTPEFTNEIEVGTNLSFFKKRINLDLSIYKKISTDLIAPVSLPESAGYTQLYTNFGEISNKGIEIDLTIRPIQTKSFYWDIHGAFTKNKNIVVKLKDGIDRFATGGVLTSISPYFEAGLPYGYLRGTKSLRDDNGNLLINPATGGMIVADDQGIIGDPNPDYKLGITNTFSYKGFFLSALFDMTQGGDLYSVTVTSELGRGVSEDTKDRGTTWVIPGVYGDPNTKLPIMVGGKTVPNQTRITTNDLYFSPNATTGATFGINTATEWNVYDATVYRLREITLGYEIPKSLFGKLPINGATLSLSGRNLWFLAPNFPKYTNFDPEVNSYGATNVQGIELSAAPTTRRYGVNLNINF
ncbi:MAG: SusC/RagA family TonB-linked outer membrane protein [Chitinophagaceae bacterium]